MPNVVARVELHAFEIPIRLRRQSSRQAGGGGSLRTYRVLEKNFADDFGKVHELILMAWLSAVSYQLGAGEAVSKLIADG
jgi:hypothetical protein